MKKLKEYKIKFRACKIIYKYKYISLMDKLTYIKNVITAPLFYNEDDIVAEILLLEKIIDDEYELSCILNNPDTIEYYRWIDMMYYEEMIPYEEMIQAMDEERYIMFYPKEVD